MRPNTSVHDYADIDIVFTNNIWEGQYMENMMGIVQTRSVPGLLIIS